AQAHLTPAVGGGVDHGAVGLELDGAGRHGEADAGPRVGVQPVGEVSGLLLADGADGLIAGTQAAQLGQVFGGLVEGPGSTGQAEEFAGVWAEKAGDAQALVEGIHAVRAAGTDQVEAVEADVTGSGQDGPGDASFVPGEPVAVGAAS